MASTKVGPWDTKINRLVIGDTSLILEDPGLGEMLFTIDDVEVMSLTVDGMQLFDSGPRIDAIYDNDDLSPDSATGLASQQSIKAYVDTAIGVISTDSIEEGDSSVEVIDTGTGRVEITVDSNIVGTWAAAGLTMVEALIMPDNKNIVLGAAGIIYSDSTSIVLANAAGTEVLMKATQDGAVELYYDNTKEGETVSGALKATNGFTIAAEHTVTAFTGLDVNLVTGTGGTANLARWNADGDAVESSSAITDGNLDTLINGVAITLHKHNADYIPIADAGSYYTGIEVETALQEVGLNLATHVLNGWEDRTLVTLSSDSGTPPTITLTFTGTVYWWSDGVRYSDSGTDAIQITDTTGTHVIYYDGSTLSKILNPSHNQLDGIIENKCICAYVYWNTNSDTTPLLAYETHGVTMSGTTHHYLHDTRGAVYLSGGGISGYTLATASDAAVSFDLTDIEFYDEDFDIEIEDGVASTQYEQVLTGDAEIPVLYKDDVDGSWVEQAASSLPYILQGGDTYPSYNNDDGDGTWSLIELANQKYMVMWVIATNDWQYPVKMVCGSETYNTLALAKAGSDTEVVGWGTLPAAEFITLYQFVIQASAGGTKSLKIVEITDYRSASGGGSAAASSDHGSLSGLGDDDHTQYLLADATRELTANWDVGAYTITGTQFISDIAIGTAPLVVTSTTVVANLNVDQVDGLDSTDFVLVDGTQDMVMAASSDWAITDADGDNIAIFASNGSVELYDVNDKIFDTTTNGFYFGGSNSGLLTADGTDIALTGQAAGGTVEVAGQSSGAAATWNPADKDAGITLSGGDLIATTTGTAWDAVRSTLSKSTGKWYWEILAGTTANAIYGCMQSGDALTYPGATATGYGYRQTGQKYNSASASGYGDSWLIGDVIGVALDLDSGKIWFSKNNAWQASGDPVAGTNEAFSGVGGTQYPGVGIYTNGNYCTARFIVGDLSYSPPTGYTAVGGAGGGQNTMIDADPDGSVILYFAGSAKLTTTTTGSTLTGVLISDGLTMGDTEYLTLGAGPDGTIYSDGTSLVFGNGAHDEVFATMTDDGAVDLYHDNVNVFETTATGAQVTQTLKLNTAASQIVNSAGETAIEINANGNVELYYDNGLKFETTTNGATLTGVLISDGLTLGDNEYITLGAGPDALIYSDGTSYLVTNGAGTEYMIAATQNGAVELYYDNVKTVNTYTSGTLKGLQVTDGTDIGSLVISNGDLYLRAETSAKHVVLVGDDTGADHTILDGNPTAGVALYYDGSIGLNVTAVGIDIYDAGTARICSSYFNGDNFTIYNKVVSGTVKIEGKDSGSALTTMSIFDPDGAVELYHNNVKAVETDTNGIIVKGSVIFPAAQSASADANALDDYEEGTWTPVPADAASGGNTGDAVTEDGVYTKTGRLVTATCRLISINTTGLTAGNTFYIQGLPYAPSGFPGVGGAATAHLVDWTGNYITSFINTGASAIYFLEIGDNAANTVTIVSDISDDNSNLYLTITYIAA